MFRRNKGKGGRSKSRDDDTVALTGPGVLSSSSSALEGGDDKAGSRGRLIGLRKKKIGAGKASQATMNGGQPVAAAANMDLNRGSDPTTLMQLQQQAAQNPPPLVDAARSISTNTSNNGDKNARLPQQLTKYQQASHRPANSTERRDEKSSSVWRQPSSKNPPQSTLNAGGGSSRNVMSVVAPDRELSWKSERAHASSKPPPLVDAGESNSISAAAAASARGLPASAAPPSGAVPVARSGWSVASNASSAMNSEHYIQSLDNMPTSKSGTALPMLSAQPDERTQAAQSNDRVRAALSRQFGRSYPPQTFQQRWIVKVGAPRWDDDERRHKYKINITKNPSNVDDAGSSAADSYSQMSFASTSAKRALQDFVWLEKAMRSEYSGALLVPLLSLALYFGAMPDAATAEEESLASRSFTTDATSKGTLDLGLGPNGSNVVPLSLKFLDQKIERNETVDGTVLAHWLSDILNGVRGNGEVLLDYGVDVAESESLETFLYRHSESVDDFGPPQMNINQRYLDLGSPFNIFSSKEKCANKSLLETFMENPFECFGMETVCGGGKKRKSQETAKMSSSRGAGLPRIQNSSSYLSQSETDLAWLRASSPGIGAHSELLEAERDLIASYIKSSSLAMSTVQTLLKDEAFVGQCWKRFAVSLSNLFSVEKDLEQAHIGDSIKYSKKNQPFRKLRKSAVDDALRILARGKMERSAPSLRTLGKMLNAYYADLNCVIPAFREYSDAVNQLDEVQSIKSTNMRNNARSHQQGGQNEWSSLGYFKNLVAGGSVASAELEPAADDDLSTLGSISTAQTKAFQTRVLAHERMLKLQVTHLCKAGPLRNARMAWWYLKSESKQAINVHTAASTLRQKLSIDPDAAAALKERKYDEDEKKDNKAELELVKRLVELGSSDSDNKGEKEASHQNAIRIATEHVGRWNAKTALALMEAAGVKDAEVQIDETSRELRHVRKYAISLRENVARCLESAEALATSFILNTDGAVQISRSRREFWAAISVVFSGKMTPDDIGSRASNIGPPNTRVLSSVGIDATDRGGWLGHNGSFNQLENEQRRNCGEAARQYLKKRDNQANILISRVVKLLKDYERRLEGIESFVYMHCVGIQLEKHCSRARSKALSAWEKRTDISTAINVATKKKIPKLVQELKVKLDALPQVSHTTVIKRKEEHLASKTLKSDLHKLANRRFGRAQEVSTERVIAVMSLWAKHEEAVATEEVKALGEVVREVELSIQSADAIPAHL